MLPMQRRRNSTMTSGRPKLPREHGTMRGYAQHYYNNEPACRPCKDAAAASHRAKRGSKPRKPPMSEFERKLKQASNIVNQWKLDQKHCADCRLPITEHTLPAIDCDHIDPSTKSFGISEHKASVAKAALIAELAKCQARCRNCHAIRTHKEQHHLLNKTETQADDDQPRLFDVI